MCNYMKLSLIAIMIILSTVIKIQPCRGAKAVYIWHHGSKQMLIGDGSGYVLEGKDPYGSDDIFIPLDQKDIVHGKAMMQDHPISAAMREAERRIFHNNAWRLYQLNPASVIQKVRDVPKDVPVVNGLVLSYMLDDKFITFPTAAELAISDAKKKLWHKGAWHDAVWKDNAMNTYVADNARKTYFAGNPFVTLNEAEVHESDLKRTEDAKKKP